MNLTTGRPDVALQPQLAAPKLSRTLRATDLPADLRRQIPLTDRQLDVMLLTRAGLSDKEIGVALCIKGSTLCTHRRRARAYFGNAPLIAIVLMLDRLLHKEGL